MPAKILTVFNQKGGCAKTMTAMQLAGAFGLRGLKVFVADMDPQNTAALWFHQAAPEQPFPAEVMSMAALKEGFLDKIGVFIARCDLVVIDCPPALGSRVPWAALVASDMALIPVVPVMDNVWASKQAEELVVEAREARRGHAAGGRLEAAYLLSMVRRGKVFEHCLQTLRSGTRIPVLRSTVALRNAFPESQLYGCVARSFGKSAAASRDRRGRRRGRRDARSQARQGALTMAISKKDMAARAARAGLMAPSIEDRLRQARELVASHPVDESPLPPAARGAEGGPLAPSGVRLAHVPLALIDANPYNARRIYRPTRVSELAASIGAHGQEVPGIASPRGGRYVLAAGHYRLRALRLLGAPTMALMLHERLSDRELYALSYRENAEREGHSALDDALAWRELLDGGVYASETEIAEATGLSLPSVNKTLAALRLSAPVLDVVKRGPGGVRSQRALRAGALRGRRRAGARAGDGAPRRRRRSRPARGAGGPRAARVAQSAQAQGNLAPVPPAARRPARRLAQGMGFGAGDARGGAGRSARALGARRRAARALRPGGLTPGGARRAGPGACRHGLVRPRCPDARSGGEPLQGPRFRGTRGCPQGLAAGRVASRSAPHARHDGCTAPAVAGRRQPLREVSLYRDPCFALFRPRRRTPCHTASDALQGEPLQGPATRSPDMASCGRAVAATHGLRHVAFAPAGSASPSRAPCRACLLWRRHTAASFQSALLPCVPSRVSPFEEL